MEIYDVVIVGSGPAGVSAAMQLGGGSVLMLDVGHTAPDDLQLEQQGNLYDLRETRDMFEALIGRRYESLHNLDRRYLSPKLKAPLMRFITRSPEGAPRFDSEAFEVTSSYARGGLANAWGAGVFRFNDLDLAAFPIRAVELEPFYDELTRHIGISGEHDDLANSFGTADDLQPPLPLSRISASLLRRCIRNRRFLAERGIRVGRTRAAILTRPHRSRAGHRAENREFFAPNLEAIYHPGYTLDELIGKGQIRYAPGHLVLRFDEQQNGNVEVTARRLDDGSEVRYRCRKLLLAAGALNSAYLALSSDDDFTSRLPLLDNAVSYVPMVDPMRIGTALDVHSFSGAELVAIYHGPLSDAPIQATFYGLVAPLRSDLIMEFPFAVRDNLTAVRYLTPATGMLQLFYPDRPRGSNYMQLRPDRSVHIEYTPVTRGAVERHLIGSFRRLGYLSLPSLVQMVPPGASMHYAGTLGMREYPSGPYQTDRFGRLFGTANVHVVDGAAFPALPSKNLTFTIMANAMRIAAQISRELA